MTLEAHPRAWSQVELEALADPIDNSAGVVVDLLDSLDRQVQEARRAWESSPVAARAWAAGYLEAVEYNYAAVERHALALGLLNSGWS